MNEEVKVMKDDRGVEYRCLTYTSRYTGETDVAFDIQQYMNNGNIYIGLGCNEEGYLEVRGKWILKRLSARILINSLNIFSSSMLEKLLREYSLFLNFSYN